MRTAHKATVAVMIAAATMTAGYEGLRTHAYKDSVNVTTICFGETRAERPNLKMGDTDTVANCRARLPIALKKYDDGLTACLTRDVPDGMHAVLISTAFNIGVPAFCHSSMARLINRGDFIGACHALRAWNRGGGQVIPGLDRRRRLEEHDCLAGLYDDKIPTLNKKELSPWNSPSTPYPSSASLPSSSASTSTASSPPTPNSPAPSRPEPLLSRLLRWLSSR